MAGFIFNGFLKKIYDLDTHSFTGLVVSSDSSNFSCSRNSCLAKASTKFSSVTFSGGLQVSYPFE